MPILVQRMYFDIMLGYVPKSSSPLVRPIVGKVFNQLKNILTDADLKKNIMMVCGGIFELILILIVVSVF